MKRYPNDPMYMSAYDDYDYGISTQRTSRPSKIFVPDTIQMPNNIQVPPIIQPPNNIQVPPTIQPPNNIQVPPNNIQPIQAPIEEIDEDDYEAAKSEKRYMISLYPDLCKKIQLFVDEECDELEYDGSLMYDDYPDKEAILAIVAKIYVKLEKDNVVPKCSQEVEAESENIDAQQLGIPGNVWLWDNIQVQFLNELFGRRRYRYPRRYPAYPYRYGYRRPYRRYPYLPYYPYQPYVPYNYRYYYYY